MKTTAQIIADAHQLKDELFISQMNHNDADHYRQCSESEALLFQSHLLVNHIMTLQEIMDHNVIGRIYDRQDMNNEKVAHLIGMIHALYEVKKEASK
tara:strand:+ start:748 stop:1038 length:291 start_codon:yes stop_codon:yes gene_type:complete